MHFGPSEAESELSVAADFFGEADTATALDTAFEVESDVLAEGIGFREVPFDFNESAGRWAVGEGVVLKRAFSTAVANWAVEGVVNEEEFEDTFSVFVDLFCVGIDDHVVAGGESAGGLRFWHFTN